MTRWKPGDRAGPARPEGGMGRRSTEVRSESRAGPTCRRCGRTVRIIELRGTYTPVGSWDSKLNAWTATTYPLGAVSACSGCGWGWLP